MKQEGMVWLQQQDGGGKRWRARGCKTEGKGNSRDPTALKLKLHTELVPGVSASTTFFRLDEAEGRILKTRRYKETSLDWKPTWIYKTRQLKKKKKKDLLAVRSLVYGKTAPFSKQTKPGSEYMHAHRYRNYFKLCRLYLYKEVLTKNCFIKTTASLVNLGAVLVNFIVTNSFCAVGISIKTNL